MWSPSINCSPVRLTSCFVTLMASMRYTYIFALEASISAGCAYWGERVLHSSCIGEVWSGWCAARCPVPSRVCLGTSLQILVCCYIYLFLLVGWFDICILFANAKGIGGWLGTLLLSHLSLVSCSRSLAISKHLFGKNRVCILGD